MSAYPGPVMFVECHCGRRLARVTRPMRGQHPVERYRFYGLTVRAAAGVPMTTWERQHRVNDDDDDWDDPTYSWRCACGRNPQVRHNRLVEEWTSAADTPKRRFTVVVR